MLGPIIGDVVGSVYEYNNIKREDFPLFKPSTAFTDDTVMTVAVADALLNRPKDLDDRTGPTLYAAKLRAWGRRYPDADYGGMFRAWLRDGSAGPYNSYGNGSAMRVGPIGFAFPTLEETLREAAWSAAVTHNHPEGIKGAQATASAIFLARTGENKDGIRDYITRSFGYDLGRSLEEIRDSYSYDVTCQGTVPEAITAFLASRDFEDALRKAVSLGGDSDTLACITCGIAQAYYKEIPASIAERVVSLLDPEIRAVLARFEETFGAWR
ncbi:MAG: ADP-ribosylglycohydrolase family protein [Bacteroidota bacterium]